MGSQATEGSERTGCLSQCLIFGYADANLVLLLDGGLNFEDKGNELEGIELTLAPEQNGIRRRVQSAFTWSRRIVLLNSGVNNVEDFMVGNHVHTSWQIDYLGLTFMAFLAC